MSRNDAKTSEVLTGLFVLVALLILGAATLWIAGVDPLAERRESYEVMMKGAGGVRPGDEVRVSGVQVGRVEDVLLTAGDEWPVRFLIAIDAGVAITTEGQARFSSDGLLGSSYLEIDTGPAGGERLPAGGRIYGSEAGGLAQAIVKAEEVAEQASVLIQETTVLVRELQARTGPVLERAEALLSEENVAEMTATVKLMRRTLEQTGPRLPALIERLDALAADLQTGVRKLPDLAEDLQALVADLQTAVGPDGERITSTLVAAEGALDAVDGSLSVVETSSGEIEAMLRDLRQASANLKTFSQSIKEQPAKVLRTLSAPERKPGEGVRQ